MRHLKNKLSGKLFCEVKSPKITPNTTDTGSMLGTEEPWCSTCVQQVIAYLHNKHLPKSGRWIRLTNN